MTKEIFFYVCIAQISCERKFLIRHQNQSLFRQTEGAAPCRRMVGCSFANDALINLALNRDVLQFPDKVRQTCALLILLLPECHLMVVEPGLERIRGKSNIFSLCWYVFLITCRFRGYQGFVYNRVFDIFVIYGTCCLQSAITVTYIYIYIYTYIYI